MFLSRCWWRTSTSVRPSWTSPASTSTRRRWTACPSCLWWWDQWFSSAASDSKLVSSDTDMNKKDLLKHSFSWFNPQGTLNLWKQWLRHFYSLKMYFFNNLCWVLMLCVTRRGRWTAAAGGQTSWWSMREKEVTCRTPPVRCWGRECRYDRKL